MSHLFTSLFGKSADLNTIHSNGAIVLDVRTPEEFRTGHMDGAINIPVDRIKQNIPDLQKKGKPIIACCRSGAWDTLAKRIR